MITGSSIPSVVPRSEAYSITIASSGQFPVRSPMPSSEQLTLGGAVQPCGGGVCYDLIEIVVTVPLEHFRLGIPRIVHKSVV